MATDPAPRLETERLILRGHRIDDFPDSAAMWADPEVVAQISGAPSSGEQSWSRFLRYTGHWLHLGFGYWAVLRKADGAFLGEVGFADYQRETDPALAGTPEAGWVFARSAQGRGYAVEAVTAMLAWADAALDHPKTAVMIAPGHAASIKLARTVGYCDEVMGRYGDRPALFLHRARR
jgi:RimJ/RimL family protein N-acetyltransferase